jgi:hypothetical protein
MKTQVIVENDVSCELAFRGFGFRVSKSSRGAKYAVETMESAVDRCYIKKWLLWIPSKARHLWCCRSCIFQVRCFRCFSLHLNSIGRVSKECLYLAVFVKCCLDLVADAGADSGRRVVTLPSSLHHA